MKRFIYLLGMLLSVSCGEQFLDLKPVSNIVTPTSADDFEALLDASTGLMNGNSSHALGLIGGDEFYVSDALWNSPNQWGPPPQERFAYVWNFSDIYEPETQDPDWNMAYRRILNANIALEGVDKYAKDDNTKWRIVKGRALFFRAINHYQLAQLFCKGYHAATAREELGLPLRLTSDLAIDSKRESLYTTYHQIEEDILTAIDLLPDTEVIYQRPSKLACYSLLARMYLNQGRYDEALAFCDRVLAVKDILFDFNDLDMSSNPFSSFSAMGNSHPEVIFSMDMRATVIASYGYFSVDTTLLASYENDDLRKNVYFMDYLGTTMFRGGYTGTGAFFSGFATDEIYLIKAEVLARKGAHTEAVGILNFLRQHRFSGSGSAILDSADPTEVLEWVLLERRKELFVRGVRWEDLKRLGSTGILLKRNLNGDSYSIAINRNVMWPFPQNVLNMGGY